jgi:hypothetical protein
VSRYTPCEGHQFRKTSAGARGLTRLQANLAARGASASTSLYEKRDAATPVGHFLSGPAGA